MPKSSNKSYEELPLFLGAKEIAQLLGVSRSTCYELMKEPDFPLLQIGSRMIVPRDKFVQWVNLKTGGSELEQK